MNKNIRLGVVGRILRRSPRFLPLGAHITSNPLPLICGYSERVTPLIVTFSGKSGSRAVSVTVWRDVRLSVQGLPGGAVVKGPPANAGDKGLIPGLGRSHALQSN